MYPQSCVLSKNKKNVKTFFNENFHLFTTLKITVYCMASFLNADSYTEIRDRYSAGKNLSKNEIIKYHKPILKF